MYRQDTWIKCGVQGAILHPYIGRIQITIFSENDLSKQYEVARAEFLKSDTKTDVIFTSQNWNAQDLGVPSMEIGVPSVGIGVPSMEIGVPSVEISLILEIMGVPSEEIYIGVPSVEIDVPSVEIDVPSVEIDVPSVEIDVPSVEIDVPSVEIDVPSVEIDVPSSVEISLILEIMGVPSEEIRVLYFEIGVGVPSMGVGVASVGVGVPSVEIGVPSVRIGGPSVENVLSVMAELFTRVSVDILQSMKCSHFASSYNILWLNRHISHRWERETLCGLTHYAVSTAVVLKYPRQF